MAPPRAENLVHDLRSSRDHWAHLAPVDNFGSPGAGMPRQPRDLLDGHSLVTHHADEGGAQFLRDPP